MFDKSSFKISYLLEIIIAKYVGLLLWCLFVRISFAPLEISTKNTADTAENNNQ